MGLYKNNLHNPLRITIKTQICVMLFSVPPLQIQSSSMKTRVFGVGGVNSAFLKHMFAGIYNMWACNSQHLSIPLSMLQ
jgi:hypothetical protein